MTGFVWGEAGTLLLSGVDKGDDSVHFLYRLRIILNLI